MVLGETKGMKEEAGQKCGSADLASTHFWGLGVGALACEQQHSHLISRQGSWAFAPTFASQWVSECVCWGRR